MLNDVTSSDISGMSGMDDGVQNDYVHGATGVLPNEAPQASAGEAAAEGAGRVGQSGMGHLGADHRPLLSLNWPNFAQEQALADNMTDASSAVGLYAAQPESDCSRSRLDIRGGETEAIRLSPEGSEHEDDFEDRFNLSEYMQQVLAEGIRGETDAEIDTLRTEVAQTRVESDLRVHRMGEEVTEMQSLITDVARQQLMHGLAAPRSELVAEVAVMKSSFERAELRLAEEHRARLAEEATIYRSAASRTIRSESSAKEEALSTAFVKEQTELERTLFLVRRSAAEEQVVAQHRMEAMARHEFASMESVMKSRDARLENAELALARHAVVEEQAIAQRRAVSVALHEVSVLKAEIRDCDAQRPNMDEQVASGPKHSSSVANLEISALEGVIRDREAQLHKTRVAAEAREQHVLSHCERSVAIACQEAADEKKQARLWAKNRRRRAHEADPCGVHQETPGRYVVGSALGECIASASRARARFIIRGSSARKAQEQIDVAAGRSIDAGIGQHTGSRAVGGWAGCGVLDPGRGEGEGLRCESQCRACRVAQKMASMEEELNILKDAASENRASGNRVRAPEREAEMHPPIRRAFDRA